MEKYLGTTLLISGVSALVLLFTKLYNAREATRRLQKQGVPMPEFSFLAGHLKALGETSKSLPRDVIVHTIMWQMSKKFPGGLFYLDLWPFSSPMVVVVSPTVAAQIEKHNDVGYGGLNKGENVEKPLETLIGRPNLMTMHGVTWKKWRRFFNPGFSPQHMLELAPLIADEAAVFQRLLRERIAANPGQVFQLEEMTLRLTFDVISSVTLETRMHYQERDNKLARCLRRQIEWTVFRSSLNPFVRYLSPRPIVQWFTGRQMARYISAEIDRRFDERVQAKTDASRPAMPDGRSKSIVSLLMDSFLDGGEHHQASASIDEAKKAMKEIMIPQLCVFLFAGNDTTSSTILYCYHLLSQHPKVAARLRAEHNDIFGTDPAHASDLIHQDPQCINRLTYTTAVIKEVLRLFPPTGSMRHSNQDIVLVDDEGRQCPTKGCNIMTLPLAIHHNPKYWSDPESFQPERWLVGPDHPLYPDKKAWRAFEHGPRACIGQTLAMLELKVVLVMTIRQFNIVPSYDEWDKANPRPGIKTVEGNRVYQVMLGGGGGHPVNGFPVKVSLR